MRTIIIFCLCLLLGACNNNEPFDPLHPEGPSVPVLSYINESKLQTKHNQDSSDDGILRVFAIGNSYTENAVLVYLHSLLMNQGIKAEIGALIKSSSSLAEQLELGMKDSRNFTFYYVPLDGIKIERKNFTMEEALCYSQWDYVSVQQYSKLSGQPQSILPYLSYLLTYIRNNVPNDAKMLWHQTWAYDDAYSNPNFSIYNYNQSYMYSCIYITSEMVLKNYDFFDIIPCGTAIQNARNSEISSLLSQDGTHLSKPVGCYLASCVWAEILTSIPAPEFIYYPDDMSREEASIAQLCAHNAILEWKNNLSCN